MQTITVRIVRDGSWFVSHCLDYDVASQGRTLDEARANVVEAESCFLESASPDEVQSRLEAQGRIEQLRLPQASI